MAEAYIVEAVRTAGGRRNGKLAGWHPADMAAETLNAVVERSGIDPVAVEDVILGCVTQAGEQAFGHCHVRAFYLSNAPGVRRLRREKSIICGSGSRFLTPPYPSTEDGATARQTYPTHGLRPFTPEQVRAKRRLIFAANRPYRKNKFAPRAAAVISPDPARAHRAAFWRAAWHARRRGQTEAIFAWGSSRGA